MCCSRRSTRSRKTGRCGITGRMGWPCSARPTQIDLVPGRGRMVTDVRSATSIRRCARRRRMNGRSVNRRHGRETTRRRPSSTRTSIISFARWTRPWSHITRSDWPAAAARCVARIPSPLSRRRPQRFARRRPARRVSRRVAARCAARTRMARDAPALPAAPRGSVRRVSARAREAATDDRAVPPRRPSRAGWRR